MTVCVRLVVFVYLRLVVLYFVEPSILLLRMVIAGHRNHHQKHHTLSIYAAANAIKYDLLAKNRFDNYFSEY